MELKKSEGESIICIREVNDNLRRVRLGMPLTRSLRELNQSCEFKKKYEEQTEIMEGKTPLQMLVRSSTYSQRPEVKERRKEYNKKYNKRKEGWKPPRKRCLECKKLFNPKYINSRYCNDECKLKKEGKERVKRYKEDEEYRNSILERNKVNKKNRNNKSTTINWKEERKKVKLYRNIYKPLFLKPNMEVKQNDRR